MKKIAGDLALAVLTVVLFTVALAVKPFALFLMWAIPEEGWHS